MEKRYYREWLSGWGWGIMLRYDTVMAYSVADAHSQEAPSMYAGDKSFESVELVKDEHLELTDDELSKIYGVKE